MAEVANPSWQVNVESVTAPGWLGQLVGCQGAVAQRDWW